MSLIANDLWPQRLELIKEILPRASRVAIFWNKSNTGMAIEAKATQGRPRQWELPCRIEG
jgi:hypothetical protein